MIIAPFATKIGLDAGESPLINKGLKVKDAENLVKRQGEKMKFHALHCRMPAVLELYGLMPP